MRRRLLVRLVLSCAGALAFAACAAPRGPDAAPDSSATEASTDTPSAPDVAPVDARDVAIAIDVPRIDVGTMDATDAARVDASDATLADATDTTSSDATDVPVADDGAPVDVVPPPPAPRQIAPLSTATTTSRRPTFHWSSEPGTDATRLEICATRSCTTIEETLDATGTSVAPAAALSPGVHYWRLRGLTSGAPGLGVSPTWEFVIGHRTAPVDTSWGSVLDLNGDGFADLAVGAYGVSGFTGRVYVYHGSATGIGTVPATTLTGPDGRSGQFNVVASAGDLNGDGYADLAVGAFGVAMSSGRAYVYLGSATGIASTPSVTLNGPGVAVAYFATVASAGDVNGDGYSDLMVGAGGFDMSAGRAYLYLGGPTGIATLPSTTLIGPDGARGGFGTWISSSDVNGDGYGDVVVGAGGADMSRGRVYVFHGSATGLAATASTTITGPDGTDTGFGRVVESTGDLDGDGYADLAVGAPRWSSSMGRAYVFRGSAAGIMATAATTLTGPDGGGFGVEMTSAGDLDGDGFADLVVRAPSVLSSTGRAYVYPGTATGIANTPTTTLTGPDGAFGLFGESLASAGDANGDGYADLAVGAVYVMSMTGRAYVYSGSATGVAAAPTTTLPGPDGPNSFFGASIAN